MEISRAVRLRSMRSLWEFSLKRNDNSLSESPAFLLWGHLGTSPNLYKESVNIPGWQRSYTGDDKGPRSQERKKCGLGRWEKKQHWQASEEEGTSKQEDVREPNAEKEQTKNQKLWSKPPSCTLSRPQKAAVMLDSGTVPLTPVDQPGSQDKGIQWCFYLLRTEPWALGLLVENTTTELNV